MKNHEFDSLIELICKVYKNRGFVTFDEVQEQLDNYGASLIETTRVMNLLEERGCRITDKYDGIDDFSLYDGTYSENKIETNKRFSSFLEKEKIQEISELDYNLNDYELGVLYYLYLRLFMNLSKVVAKQHIICLQKAYNMFLDEGEYKIIFDIQSSLYVQEIYIDLLNKKKHGKVKAMFKTAVLNYQHFLEKNRHHVIAVCEEKL